ncbi:hypothetical protein G7046_g5338 [Stylonectria norvegica]|nr:hypothetical protein G7046_g5338 [Stylonectria norvegica]
MPFTDLYHRGRQLRRFYNAYATDEHDFGFSQEDLALLDKYCPIDAVENDEDNYPSFWSSDSVSLSLARRSWKVSLEMEKLQGRAVSQEENIVSNRQKTLSDRSSQGDQDQPPPIQPRPTSVCKDGTTLGGSKHSSHDVHASSGIRQSTFPCIPSSSRDELDWQLEISGSRPSSITAFNTLTEKNLSFSNSATPVVKTPATPRSDHSFGFTTGASPPATEGSRKIGDRCLEQSQMSALLWEFYLAGRDEASSRPTRSEKCADMRELRHQAEY